MNKWEHMMKNNNIHEKMKKIFSRATKGSNHRPEKQSKLGKES